VVAKKLTLVMAILMPMQAVTTLAAANLPVVGEFGRSKKLMTKLTPNAQLNLKSLLTILNPARSPPQRRKKKRKSPQQLAPATAGLLAPTMTNRLAPIVLVVATISQLVRPNPEREQRIVVIPPIGTKHQLNPTINQLAPPSPPKALVIPPVLVFKKETSLNQITVKIATKKMPVIPPVLVSRKETSPNQLANHRH
jgi:hypothetical protein